MKQILFILSFFLVPMIGFSQPNVCLDEQSSGSIYTLKIEKGAFKGSLGLVTNPYADTTEANSKGIACYPGALIVVNNEVLLRNNTATRWLKVGVVGNFLVDVFRKTATDSVFVTKANGDTSFAFIDSIGSGGSGVFDTTNIYLELDKRVKYTDTAAMLSPYLTDAYIDIDAVGDSGFSLLKKSGGRDTVIVRGGGGSGGSFDTTTIYLELNKRVKYTDTAAMLLPYLKVIDTTGKWFADAAKINDSIYRFYKGNSFFDVKVPIGGSFDTTTIYSELAKRVKYTDTATMLLPYLRIIDTTNKWFANASKINDTTYRFYKGSNFFDVISPNSYNKVTTLTDSSGFVLYKRYGGTDTVRIKGGSATPDTIFTKFPVQVEESGDTNFIKLKYPPNSVAVNLTNDTADVQFLPIYRVTNQTSPDTVRWIATTTIPSGTPEIYYSWSQVGKQVTVKIWAYYPTAGTAVTSASINLPPDCPEPLVPGGWTTTAEMIVSVGAGGLFVNRERTINDLPTATASSVLRRNTANTGWEIITKMSGGSYRYLVANMIYEAQ